MKIQPRSSRPRDEAAARPDASLLSPSRRPLLLLVLVVVTLGAVILAVSVSEARHLPFGNGLLLSLAVLTIATGRFVIKLPGRPGTVTVSETFLFALVLLFGPAAAALVVAIDGVWVSYRQKHRRLYRALFNVTEPAVSIWLAGHAYFAIAGIQPMEQTRAATPILILATVAMAAVFFLLNGTLTAAAIGWDSGGRAYDVWRGHVLYLAINYYAAASVAMLCVANGLNPMLAGLVVPLLVLSYIAYKEASSRLDDAHRHVQEVRQLYQATVEMLAITVEGKDRTTHGHVCRVQRHALAVARALGVKDETELKAIEAGSILHDIGKVVVPDHILNKPVALTRSEFDTMKRHASMGARILTAVDFPSPVVPIVRHHHERWDGRGYPDGLLGSEIPLGARILAVVDCFDALTSDRPYRSKMSDEQALEILQSRSGTFYDPTVVEKFVDLVPRLRGEDLDDAEDSGPVRSVVAGIHHSVSERPAASQADGSAAIAAALRRSIGRLIDDWAARIRGAEGVLFVADPSGDVLTVACAAPRLREAVAAVQLPLGHGVSGWVGAHRTTICNADPRLDFGDLADRLGLVWSTSTPVFTCGEMVGVLTVYLTRDDDFSAQECRYVGSLAQEVGMLLAREGGDPSEHPEPVFPARPAEPGPTALVPVTSRVTQRGGRRAVSPGPAPAA